MGGAAPLNGAEPATTATTAAAAAAIELPTVDALCEVHRKCCLLLRVMRARSASGGDKSGRYKAHDTARKFVVETVVLPGLQRGRMPSTRDQRMLFELPGPGPVEIEGLEKAEMDEWTKSKYTDPRSKSNNATESVSKLGQLCILLWARAEGTRVTSARGVESRRGAPKLHRMPFGLFKGKTVVEMVKDGAWYIWKFLFNSNGADPPPFTWSFPEHIDLYHDLLELEHADTLIKIGDARDDAHQLEVPRNVKEEYARYVLGPDLAARVLPSPTTEEMAMQSTVAAAAPRPFFARTVPELDHAEATAETDNESESAIHGLAIDRDAFAPPSDVDRTQNAVPACFYEAQIRARCLGTERIAYIKDHAKQGVSSNKAAVVQLGDGQYCALFLVHLWSDEPYDGEQECRESCVLREAGRE